MWRTVAVAAWLCLVSARASVVCQVNNTAGYFSATSAGGVQTLPSIALINASMTVVVWQSTGQSSSDEGLEVYARMLTLSSDRTQLTPSGAAQDVVRVNTATKYDQKNARVAVIGASGLVAVVFQSSVDVDSQRMPVQERVLLQLFSSVDMTPRGPEVVLSDGGGDETADYLDSSWHGFTTPSITTHPSLKAACWRVSLMLMDRHDQTRSGSIAFVLIMLNRVSLLRHWAMLNSLLYHGHLVLIQDAHLQAPLSQHPQSWWCN